MLNLKNLRRYLFSKNRLIFCEFFLDKIKGWEKPNGIVFERFNTGEMELLDRTLQEMDFKSDFTLDDAIARFQKGYFFYVAKRQSRIIGYCWWAVKNHHIQYFHGSIKLRPNEIYCLNNYIDKAFRGLGLLNMLKAYAFCDLKNYGYTRDIVGYFSWNKAAKRANEKLGYSFIGSVTYGYVFTIRYLLNTVTTNKISFNRVPLSFWKKLSKKIRNQ